MLSVKQGGMKYNFLSLWYDSTWDWTPIFRIIGKHSEILWYFMIQMDPQFPTWKLDLLSIDIMKRICHAKDFAVITEYRVKMKESKNSMEKQRKMKGMVMLKTVSKVLGKRLKELEIRS